MSYFAGVTLDAGLAVGVALALAVELHSFLEQRRVRAAAAAWRLLLRPSFRRLRAAANPVGACHNNQTEFRVSRLVPEPEPPPASRRSRCPELRLSPTRSPAAPPPRSPSTWHATCDSASFPSACPGGTLVCVQCITLPTLSEWDGLISGTASSSQEGGADHDNRARGRRRPRPSRDRARHPGGRGVWRAQRAEWHRGARP